MSLDSSNVRVGISGKLMVADTGTTMPDSATDSPDDDFKDLGYFSDDGVTESRDRDTEEIRAWQNASLVREVVTSGSLSFQGTLLETKKDTVELFYGNSVQSEDGSMVIVPTKSGGRKSFILDIVDGDKTIRYCVPEGEISEVGDVTYASGEAIGYEITVKAYDHKGLEDGDGNTGVATRYQSDLEGDEDGGSGE